MTSKGDSVTLSHAVQTVGDADSATAHTLTATSDTNTRAESRRTEDEAVTLPIPSSGLLTSPTQVGGQHVLPSWFGGVSSTVESHFSLAPLLGRSAPSSAISPGKRAAITSTDGAVRMSGSPRPWPTPPHAIREFGHMPSRACSSGGTQTPSRRRSSGNVTLGGMMVAAGTVEEEREEQLTDPACSECSNTPTGRDPDQEAQDAEPRGDQAAYDVQAHVLNSAVALAVAIVDDGACDETPCGAMTGEPSANYDGEVAEPRSATEVEVEPGESSAVMPEDSALLGDVVASAGCAQEVSDDATGAVCGSFGPSGAEEVDGPQWLTAEECAVSDAITQLQAVVSGLSEPYQRYIRERALELTRIIDENLQRQGLEPVTSGGSGPGTGGGMATPSKKAATAAAALVLAVAASGTQWPYSTQSAGDSGEPGGDFANAVERDDDAVDDTCGDSSAPDDARWLFRSPQLGRSGGIDLVGAPTPLVGAPTQALSYGAPAASGSCTLCFGSVLGNSQVRAADSAEQTSGAVSARAPTSSHPGPASNRSRSRSYSSYYAQQQSQRRLANMRAIGGQPPSASALSSACSNPYPQEFAQQPSTGRRVPPRPPPRGLGCGLGKPRKMASEGSGPRPDPCIDPHNLPYLMVPPVLEPATAREPLQGPSSARPRVSAGQQLDQQQPHDQDDFTGLLDDGQEQQHHDTASHRRAAGRPASGSNAILRPGNGGSGGGGGHTKNAAITNRGGIRPAAPTPAGYQPPWQRPPPAGRSASEKHRADPSGQTDVKSRKAVTRVLSARGEPGMPSQPAAHRRGTAAGGASARRPLPSARTVTSECDELSAVASAREPTCSEAGSCYQQLLRKSGGARSSLASINRRGTVGAAPPSAGLLPSSHRLSARINSYPIATSSDFHSHLPTGDLGGGTIAGATTDPGDTPRTHEVCSAGGGHREAAGTTWDHILPSELPYHLVHAFPAVGSVTDDVDAAAVRLEWQPLHTALTLDELTALARQPAGSSEAGARGAQQHSRTRGSASNGGAGSVSGRALVASAFAGAPFDVDGNEEPATAFAIVSRRGTRDMVDDLAPQSSAAATSSLGDLSSLLPAPAWRHGRNGAAAETSSAGGARGAAGAAAAGALSGGQRVPSELGNSIISGCSTQIWDNGNNVPDQMSRVREGSVTGGFGIGVPMSRDPTFGGAAEQQVERGGGGSAAAQLRSVLASMGGTQGGAAGSGQGRRWQLDADRLVVPDKEQIRAGSPVRLRYAGNSDSHLSPAAPEPQPPVVRRRGASSAREGRGAKASGRGTGGVAGAGTGSSKGLKGSNTKRSNGTLGSTGRASGGGRSRSTPHARAAKAIRAARGHGSSSRPPAPLPPGPAPAPVLLPQRPTTPVAPSSPPPPQQSQTPVQLQQQQQQGPLNPGARRWTDDDDDEEGVGHHSQEESAGTSSDESESTPSTPTRRRVHVQSPEDMPLSAAARNSSQPRLGVADATTRSVFDGVSGAAAAMAAAGLPPPSQTAGLGMGLGLGLGLATLPALATAATMPVAAPGWGTYTSSPQAFKLRQNPSGGLSPRLRGVAYAPLPSHRWAAGRTYTTTSIHTDGTTTTTVVTSPGLSRTAWHHDCTPNILSPPRNYDRPWATPSRKNSAQAEGAAGGELESAGYARSARMSSPRGSGRRGTGQGDDGSVLGSPTSGRRGSMTARPAFGRGSPRQGNDRQRNMDVARSGIKETEGVKSGGDVGLSAAAGPLGPISTVAEEEEQGRPNFPERVAPADNTASPPGFPPPGVATAAALGVADAARKGLAFPSTCKTDHTAKVGFAAVDIHRQAHAGCRARGAAAATGTASVAALAAVAAAPVVPNGSAGGTAAVDVATASDSEPGSRRAGVNGSAVSVLQATVPAPDMKAEGVQTDALEPTTDSTFNTLNLSQTARRSSDGSRSRGSPSGPMTARTDGGRGYGGRSGRPPIGAFRPSGSLRAAPAGTGGAQLALMHQAAWPGLRDPRVVDALSTLEAGIAVLDPAPPPPPSSLGTHDPTEGGPGSGASAPNGCFGLFNRHAAAAAHRAPPVPVQVPAVAPQRPVLLRVHVADGAVEMVLLRPRRANAGVGAVAGAGEQRVRVAALSGVHPPLGNAASAGASGVSGTAACLDDDVADPSSRWVQLVAMDGGLMRLSACSPADHARLLLGLNAGLLAAMGAIDEGAPLSSVPLCRGLGGLP